MENNKEITIGYWSTKGLGSTLRMITIYSGRPLRAKIYKLDALIKNNEIQFDGSTWHDKDKVHLKKRNSLINLPYIEMYDKNNNKVLISQSLACLSFLGRQLNMFGKDTSEETYCDQLINEVNDLRGLLGKFCYTTFLDSKDEFNGAKDVMEKATNKINGKMLKFEEWLEQKKQEETKLFLVGNSISAPDFSLFDILDFYNEFLRHYKFSTNSNEEIYKSIGFPYLSKFYNAFTKLPKMQKYFNSELYKLPYQNKAALFSSENQSIRWDPNKDIDNVQAEILIN